jgi:undecaprenyl-diphosphatase
MPLRHAILLGLIHGPTELLPVSSSAHTLLIPRLLRWPEQELPAAQRTAFEVALHGGAALGLLYALRRELGGWQSTAQDRRLQSDEQATSSRSEESVTALRPLVLALAIVLPAAVGYVLEGRFERRLGNTRALAIGLHVGGVLLALADLRSAQARRVGEASGRDGLCLGVAQALALAPGVSRNGATLTAARALGFSRADAQTLSWSVGLPVIVGATLLKGRRLLREPLPPGAKAPFAAGAGASLLATLACAPLLAPKRRGRVLWPFALYRTSLAVLAARRGLDEADLGLA